MSSAWPIKTKPSCHERALDPTTLLSSSYLSSSPIATEILARDLAECFDDEFDDDDDDYKCDHLPDLDAGEEELPVTHGPALVSRPNGIAYGTIRPIIAAETAGIPAVKSRDLIESRNAERSILRDNHILPPKHPRPLVEPLWKQLYRRCFSTKVPPVLDGEDFGPLLSAASTKSLESAPLLYNVYACPPSPTASEEEDRWEAAVAANILRTTWQREGMVLMQHSRSLIVTFLLHYSVTVTSVFTVGRIGMLELGAVSLATMTANITCYAPCQGLSTCLDTLCAQAYGSGYKHLVGLQLQRMTYLLWMLLVPIAVLWWHAGDVLSAIIPEKDTAALAGLYLRVLILGTPGVAAFESGKRFVQAQGLFHATTWVLLIGAPINILANWFFVWKMGWGFAGAASAVVFTQNLLPFLLFLYVRFVEGMECWNGLSKRALGNWGPMIKLALPGMIMVEAQYFAFELLTLASSQFGSSYLAAQSVVVTLTSTTFNISFPLSIAASTRVANLIGARLSDAARTSAKAALVAGSLAGLFNLTLLGSLRFSLPYLFTKDAEVAAIVSHVLPICAVLQLFDSLAAMSHGLLRGIGRQGIGGYTNLFSHYCVALPISFATGWGLGWKLEGLWFGVTIGLAVVSFVELWYLYQANWQHAVEEAVARMQSDEAQHHLHAVLFAPIQNFSVEFNKIPDAPRKNKVMFKIELAIPIRKRDFTVAMPSETNKGESVASGNFRTVAGEQDVSCVYVFINLSDSGTNDGKSSLQIRLVMPAPLQQAAVSFQFNLDPKLLIPITLWYMLEAIQVFIRLHALGFISWTVYSVSSPALRTPTSFSTLWVANVGFHKIIGKKYWTKGDDSGLSRNRKVFSADSLVNVGLAMSPKFVRLDGGFKARYQLLYGKAGVVGGVVAGREAGLC
ncbi:hypothetical protein N0V88_004327 [Collariella sp. IMI 366227]|nr:hypothetical protein N0V88_004327 [Collariella sp. IMI 366227]